MDMGQSQLTEQKVQLKIKLKFKYSNNMLFLPNRLVRRQRNLFIVKQQQVFFSLILI